MCRTRSTIPSRASHIKRFGRAPMASAHGRARSAATRDRHTMTDRRHIIASISTATSQFVAVDDFQTSIDRGCPERRTSTGRWRRDSWARRYETALFILTGFRGQYHDGLAADTLTTLAPGLNISSSAAGGSHAPAIACPARNLARTHLVLHRSCIH